MTKRQKKRKNGISTSIVAIVKAQCLDYERRKRLLINTNLSRELVEKYSYLNSIIDAALGNVDPGIRIPLFRDLQLGRGYAHSPASPFLAKNTYYARKWQLIRDIAEGFGLI